MQHWEDTTDSELTAFLGMLIAMGIHGLPRFRMFWSTDPLLRVHPAADIMTRQRFMKLVSNFHVNDNDKAAPRGDPAYDRLHKIRPLLREMKATFEKQAVPSSSQEMPMLAKVKTLMERGESEWLTRDNIGYVKWMDTRVVLVISTAFSPSEMQLAKRTQRDGTSVQVKCPKSIVEYTRRIGGVDTKVMSHLLTSSAYIQTFFVGLVHFSSLFLFPFVLCLLRANVFLPLSLSLQERLLV